MSNELSLRILGDYDLSPTEDFNYFAGEARRLSFQIYDEDTEKNFQLFFGDFRSGSITVFASGGSGVTTVTSTNHGLLNGSYVFIIGTTSYNGTFLVSGVSANTFNIASAFVADDGTGSWRTGPTAMVLTLPGSPTDLNISLDTSNIYIEDRSILIVDLTPAQTRQMISGFIRFDFNLANGQHRVAYAGHIQSKLLGSGS